MVDSVNLLLSKIHADRGLATLTSANITNAEVDGYTRKEAYYVTNTIGTQGVTSVELSTAQRYVDAALQRQVELQNSKLENDGTLHKYYEKIADLLGSKASHGSFVHGLSELVSSLRSVESKGTTNIQKNNVIQQGVNFCDKITQLAQDIMILRSQVDSDLNAAIEEFNSNLEATAALNKEIADVFSKGLSTANMQDERDDRIHTLNSLSHTTVTSDSNEKVILSSEKGRLYLQGPNTYLLSYSPSIVATPNQPLSEIYYAGTSGVPNTGSVVTDEFQTGKIAALLNLRDTVLVDFQSEIDELTRVIRDNVNAIHNTGTSFGGGGTLTGTKILYDVVDVSGNYVPLMGTTGFDGQGTIRIGVSDQTGNLIDYKDITLTNGMTIAGLISQIMTGSNYVNSGGSVATVGGGFTVQQLATGELQISADTPGKTITLGSVGTPTAEISAVTTTSVGFDSTRALGFSHFFGLNNFFLTDNHVYSPTTQVGLANVLKVNPSLLSNNSNLSVGQLVGTAVLAGDTSVIKNVADKLINNDLSFMAAGQQPAVVSSATDYASRIFAMMQSDISIAKTNFELRETTYNELASKAHDLSAVNPSDELLKLFEISTSQQVTAKALSIVQKMGFDLLSIIGG